MNRSNFFALFLFVMLQFMVSAEVFAESFPIDSGVALPGCVQGRLSIKEKRSYSSAYYKTVCLYASGELVAEISTDERGFFAFTLPDSLRDEYVLLMVKKSKSQKGKYVRHCKGAKVLTKGGSWTEMEVKYYKRKKIFRPKLAGCPKFR